MTKPLFYYDPQQNNVITVTFTFRGQHGRDKYTDDKGRTLLLANTDVYPDRKECLIRSVARRKVMLIASIRDNDALLDVITTQLRRQNSRCMVKDPSTPPGMDSETAYFAGNTTSPVGVFLPAAANMGYRKDQYPDFFTNEYSEVWISALPWLVTVADFVEFRRIMMDLEHIHDHQPVFKWVQLFEDVKENVYDRVTPSERLSSQLQNEPLEDPVVEVDPAPVEEDHIVDTAKSAEKDAEDGRTMLIDMKAKVGGMAYTVDLDAARVEAVYVHSLNVNVRLDENGHTLTVMSYRVRGNATTLRDVQSAQLFNDPFAAIEHLTNSWTDDDGANQFIESHKGK